MPKIVDKHAIITSLKLMGFGDIMAQRVAEELGYDTVIEDIKEDPYCVMKVDGISFVRADKIARNYFSVGLEDHRRQKAIIYNLLDNQKNLGHTYLPTLLLEKEMKKQSITDISSLEELIRSGDLVLEENRVYTRRMFMAEVGCAAIIKARMSGIDHPIVFDVSEFLGKAGEDLDDDQKEAVASAPSKRVMVVTGGPGTGKTFVTDKICQVLESRKEKVGLCAPTGKAAKRLSELTGRPASTIHRMLGATYGSWKFNKYNPLTRYSAVICDESSMLDVDLCFRLLEALPYSTKLFFVGDVDQLPPVGPGTPFRDLIKCGKVSVSRLTMNHRQGKGSVIASNAHAINYGSKHLSLDDDFQFVDCASHIHLREELPKILGGFKKDGYDLIRDVQVLSPQKTTAVGVEALNEFLRFHINKNAKRWDRFSVGDKVMQNTNDYQLEIFNGYCGQIIGETLSFYKIQFFDEASPTDYPKHKIENLIPAYCCTVHKFQGSEMKAGVAIISSSHTWMLTRNLLYTAITRFKEKCVILGDAIGLKRAISNTRESDRYSKLLERLQD